MSWFDKRFKSQTGGSVLEVPTGSKGLQDCLRINYCLMGARSEVLMCLGLDFNERTRRLGRRIGGIRFLAPRTLPDGASKGFLRKHKDHPPEVVRVCEAEEHWMVDEARRLSQRRGGSVSLVLVAMSGWSGHTPITRRVSALLADAFREPALRIGLIECPASDPDLIANLRDLGLTYPNRDALGLDGIILTERPSDESNSREQDWNLAFGIAVLAGASHFNLVHQGSGADALAPIARFSREIGGGYIRAAFGVQRVPLIPWPSPWGPAWRISRNPLATEVGSAMAQAIRSAESAGADPSLSWVMTVGVPLNPRSSLWGEAELPAKARKEAAARLGRSDFPPNIKILWSSLLCVPAYDNRHAPVASMVLWPSRENPDTLIAKHLNKPRALPPPANETPAGREERLAATATRKLQIAEGA